MGCLQVLAAFDAQGCSHLSVNDLVPNRPPPLTHELSQWLCSPAAVSYDFCTANVPRFLRGLPPGARVLHVWRVMCSWSGVCS